MQTLIERIRELKTEAKNRRDRGVKGYARGVALLEEAIAMAREGLTQSSIPELRSQLAIEIADCYGLIGGIQRRWAADGPPHERAAHLAASVLAYDAGFEFESDPQYGIVNSYNLLNRLIGRLLLRPDALSVKGAIDFGPGIASVDVSREFEQAAGSIREQLAGPRRGDYWAIADLALVQVVLGQADPASAYAGFNSLSPPDFAYTSALAGLRLLAELPMKAAPAVRDAIRLLETHLEQLRA